MEKFKEIGVIDVKLGSLVTVVNPVNLYGSEAYEDCSTTHSIMFVNHLFKAGKPVLNEPTFRQFIDIENYVFIGDSVTNLPINICEDMTRDITVLGWYFGNPACLNSVAA